MPDEHGETTDLERMELRVFFAEQRRDELEKAMEWINDAERDVEALTARVQAAEAERDEALNGVLRAWPDDETVRTRLRGYLDDPASESELGGLFGAASLGWWGNESTREVLRRLFSIAQSRRDAEAREDALREVLADALDHHLRDHRGHCEPMYGHPEHCICGRYEFEQLARSLLSTQEGTDG